jgi:hypothetical protein
MPLTAKGEEIYRSLLKEYGSEAKAKQVLYAGKKAGTFTGIDEADDELTGVGPTAEDAAIHFMRSAGKPGSTSQNLPVCGLGWSELASGPNVTNTKGDVTCKGCLRKLDGQSMTKDERKFPSYTTEQLKAMVTAGTATAAIKKEIEARESGKSSVRVIPQLTPLSGRDGRRGRLHSALDRVLDVRRGRLGDVTPRGKDGEPDGKTKTSSATRTATEATTTGNKTVTLTSSPHAVINFGGGDPGPADAPKVGKPTSQDQNARRFAQAKDARRASIHRALDSALDRHYAKDSGNQKISNVIGWQKNGRPIPTPPGIHAEDYFSNGKYLGPDEDGVEPIFR